MSDALGLSFANEQTVNEVVRANAEPDWLRAERHAGLRRALELPIETNPLFTLYVDLRAARLAEIDAVDREASIGQRVGSGTSISTGSSP